MSQKKCRRFQSGQLAIKTFMARSSCLVDLRIKSNGAIADIRYREIAPTMMFSELLASS
jgi:hypothetical protein